MNMQMDKNDVDNNSSNNKKKHVYVTVYSDSCLASLLVLIIRVEILCGAKFDCHFGKGGIYGIRIIADGRARSACFDPSQGQ